MLPMPLTPVTAPATDSLIERGAQESADGLMSQRRQRRGSTIPPTLRTNVARTFEICLVRALIGHDRILCFARRTNLSAAGATPTAGHDLDAGLPVLHAQCMRELSCLKY